MPIVFTCLSLGCCCVMILLIYNKIELLKLLALTISAFINIYIIVSGVLFGFDSFSIILTMGIVLIFSLIFLVLLIIQKIKAKIKIDKNKVCINAKEISSIIILCICIFPIIHQRNGYFCMAQDEGVYYVKALYLEHGITNNILHISEFDTINSNTYKQYMRETITEWSPGLVNPMRDLEYMGDSEIIKKQYDKYANEEYGRFHGIPTYPAMLVLFGSIFGYKNMGYLQLVTYYIYVILCFYTLKRILHGQLLQYILTLSCAIIPPIVWCGKSYLTEMYLAVLSIEILMFFLENESQSKMLSLLPIIALCFYHISAFVFIPLYYSIFLFFFFSKKNKIYLLGNIVLIIGYMCGYITNICINPAYVIPNYYGHLSFINLKNAKSLSIAIFMICILVIGFTMLIMIEKNVRIFTNDIWDRKIFPMLPYILKISIALIGGICIYRSLYTDYVERTAIIAFICFSGMFVFVVGVMHFFFSKTICTDEFFCISLFFLYCVVLLSVFYEKLLAIYYGARYLAPYIPIIFVFAGMVFKTKQAQYILCEITCLLSIKYMLIYDNILVKHQDDTRVQTQVVSDIIDTLNSDDYVFIEKGDYFSELYVPLKLAAGNVYYIKNDLQTTLNYINIPKQKKILFISDQEMTDKQYSKVAEFENYISMIADYNEVFSDLLLKSQEQRMYKDEIRTFYLYEYCGS